MSAGVIAAHYVVEAAGAVPYDVTACTTLQPTSCVAYMEVFNSSNWKTHATINGTWKNLSVSQVTFYLVYRDAASPKGAADPFALSPQQTLQPSTMGTERVGGFYGGNRVGSTFYGVQIIGSTTGLDITKTPQQAANGVLGTTDPTKCRFWWGTQIAVTADRSNEPMGGVDGSAPPWA